MRHRLALFLLFASTSVFGWECDEPEGVIVLDTPMTFSTMQNDGVEAVRFEVEVPAEVKERKLGNITIYYGRTADAWAFHADLQKIEQDDVVKAVFVAHPEKLDDLVISAYYYSFDFGCPVEIRRHVSGYNKSLNTDASDAGAG